MPITEKTAHGILISHHDIAVGKKLLADIEKSIEEKPRSFHDDFRTLRRVTMGIPSGSNGERILDVPLTLAVSVIRATIAEHERRLVELNQCAAIELQTILAPERDAKIDFFAAFGPVREATRSKSGAGE